MKKHVLALGGDGIGPEILEQGLRVAMRLAQLAQIDLTISHGLLHGASWDVHATFCTDAVLEQARGADAVLVGAVGGPKWDGIRMPGGVECQDGLMYLRHHLQTYLGLRTARAWPVLQDKTPFRAGWADRADVLVLREMCGGAMFARHRGQRQVNGLRQAYDLTAYDEAEIARFAHGAFQLARKRNKRLISCDKSNVMELPLGHIVRETCPLSSGRKYLGDGTGRQVPSDRFARCGSGRERGGRRHFPIRRAELHFRLAHSCASRHHRGIYQPAGRCGQKGPSWRSDRSGNANWTDRQSSPLQKHPTKIDAAKRAGHKMLLDGRTHCRDRGYYIGPTLIANVPNSAELAQTEIFGPVASTEAWDDEADVIRIANETAYELAAGIWTQDVTKAMRMADRIEAGTIYINNYFNAATQSPVGGYKQSGYGRENGIEGMRCFLQTKSVWLSTNPHQPDSFA